MSETANPPARAQAIVQIARLALRLSARRCRPNDRAAPSPQVPQVAALLIVDDAPAVRPLKLAAELGLGPAQLYLVLNGLEDHGVICRERLKQDRRVRQIVLTDRGDALVAAAHRYFAATLSGVPDAELDQIRQRLASLLDSIAGVRRTR